MFKTKEVALDVLNNNIEVIDLIDDVKFLREVDNSIIKLVKEHDVWSDLSVARKRKKLMDKIEKLLEQDVE